ncbi:hypothetical protein [Alkalimarinus alittae]|uniref:Lipoprotein n=1 Tax=Alkalimarinus alittae TaxID=2961619 RepID=A0ABY6N4B3_9ALTE|nr:hypothetical protein [Alkalimarinus alittae]UZE96929.1 hypothetical protein NKI27_04035 [Alkalimarinus alittae]
MLSKFSVIFVFIMLSACASTPAKTPPNISTVTSIDDYLIKLIGYYETDKKRDGNVESYRFSDAAYASDIKRLASDIRHICTLQHKGDLFTYPSNKPYYLTADYAVKSLGLDFVEHQLMASQGKVVSTSPLSIGSGRIPGLNLQGSMAYNKKSVTFPSAADHGICATHDQSTGLFQYHFIYSFFGTVSETNSSHPKPPLYLAIDKSNYMQTQQDIAIDEYAKKARENAKALSNVVSKYISDTKQQPSFDLRYIDKAIGGVVLNISINNTDKKPVEYTALNKYGITTGNGASYQIAINPLGQPAVLDGCVFTSHDNWTVLVNPNTQCKISIPGVVMGFPFEFENITLGINDETHKLIPVSEFAVFAERYR